MAYIKELKFDIKWRSHPLLYSPSIKFIKFLPDCGKVSVASYMDLLTDTVQKNWLPEQNFNFDPSCQKVELYEEYIDKMLAIKQHLEQSRLQQSPSPWISSLFWSFPSLNAEFNLANFNVVFYLTKIPHLVGYLEPPVAERNRYNSLIKDALSQGIVDESRIEVVKEIKILGKLHWVYLQKKISLFKTLSWFQTQEQSSCEEPSMVYAFAQQVEEVFLSSSMDSDIELKQRDISKSAGLSKIEIKQWDAADKKRFAEFLEKYDQMLLDAWGKEKFSENLIPLGASLDDWLKAGRD
ncbi:MAG: hypothetical protein DRR16_16640 [Candidatus Parabeggiatoa sp. nov. 3]|nr:MAG: hypothetical protein DRR00_00090 [Gammaproteobacteria bacterium]RKZ62499.1 MAG: hypothetical protein DRQ99_18605 [Gammaproteobacteria bacterium]RKZ83703.1 MAG: hypothetical protein DRR16_16640 [Gammaproteobacteria bacterium]HEW98757.1 hypothetical protein [Beggiatoa sp.]